MPQQQGRLLMHRSAGIATKLLLAQAMLVVFTIIVGAVAWVQLQRVSTSVHVLATNVLQRQRVAAQLRSMALELRATQYAHMLSDEADEQTTLRQRVDRLVKTLTDESRSLDPLLGTQDGKAAHTAFDQLWRAYATENERVLQLTGDFGIKAMGGDYQKRFDAMLAALGDIQTSGEKIAQVQTDHAETVASQTLWIIGSTVVTALVLGMAMAWTNARKISQPLLKASQSAKNIAGGDLTAPIPAGSADEVGHLLSALTEMRDGLRAIVQTVRQGVDSVATASAQIASGNADLSNRTEQQAANLQRTVSAVQQMTDGIRFSRDSADHARSLSETASQNAEKGQSTMSEVVHTMAAIKDESARIAQIVEIIDGIAAQTNILALNAAVEAARAGEHGQGFAVVANEVRTLAQRSAEAARSITGIITASVARVESGEAIVEAAGQTMGDIVTSVRSAGQIIAEMSHAARDQAQGIEQINNALAQIDQMTQQNAALVEQSAAAAHSLRQQGVTLREVVARFHVD